MQDFTFTLKKQINFKKMSKQNSIIDENLITAKEVSVLLGISRAQVERLTLKNLITPVSTPASLYYFDKTEVMNYKNSKTK